jgi:hypothetical protein
MVEMRQVKHLNYVVEQARRAQEGRAVDTRIPELSGGRIVLAGIVNMHMTARANTFAPNGEPCQAPISSVRCLIERRQTSAIGSTSNRRCDRAH